MNLYPLFADLRGRDVLVVGGGAVAERKCAALLGGGAHVRVVAPELSETLSAWSAQGRIVHVAGAYRDDRLDDTWLVIAATDDVTVNRNVAAAAKRRKIFANVVDNAALSTFQVPAVIDRAPLQIAISSGGAAPMLARAIRERLEALLDHTLGPLAALLDRAREKIRGRLRNPGARRAFYRDAIGGRVASLLRSHRAPDAEHELDRQLAAAASSRTGSVAIVGAGPGDPGLLTLNALRALNEADVILHDRLVSAEVLDLARRDAVRIEVGKQAGNHRVTQEAIHALMLDHARAGKRVVRLKGGDPFVFGRGGEELEFLRAHGIAYEVVPGVTAAVACAAYSGIPLTHRDYAQSVQFLTAHTRQSLDEFDAPSLAQQGQTLAIYMGVGQLASLRAKLLDAGRSPSTPAALIENGTRTTQRVIVGDLASLDVLAMNYSVQSPALLIVGEVARLATTLAWYGAAPTMADGARPAKRDALLAARVA